MVNPYYVLGVTPSASKADIKKAYKKLAQDSHPDKCGKSDEFYTVQTAYNILSCDEKREKYDRTGNPDSLSEPEQMLIALFTLAINKNINEPGGRKVLDVAFDELAKAIADYSNAEAYNSYRESKLVELLKGIECDDVNLFASTIRAELQKLEIKKNQMKMFDELAEMLSKYREG